MPPKGLTGFLSLEKFLAHFPEVKISRSDFVNRLKISYSPQLTLGQVRGSSKIIKDKRTDPRYQETDRLIDYLYQMCITHRKYYLAKHFKSYFEFQDPYRLNWEQGPSIKMDQMAVAKEEFSGLLTRKQYLGGLSLQKNDASRRIIRNLFYLELLYLTQPTNTVKSKVSYWTALDNFYNKLLLDDRLMSPSSVKLFLRKEDDRKPDSQISMKISAVKGKKQLGKFKFNPDLNWHNFFYQLQAYQAKASIINPYFVYWCLQNLFGSRGKFGGRAKGLKLMTPVLSWGSYLVAFNHAVGWDHYVGIDVMPSVCQKVDYLAKYYQELDQYQDGLSQRGEKKTVEIYCQPSEKLAQDKIFNAKYRAFFDLVMVCPPYFDMELYHEGQQSTDLYPNYQEWLKKYWLETVKMCHRCLRKKGKFALIINDYNTLDGENYPLSQDMSQLVIKAGFKLEGFYFLFNRTSPLRVNKKTRTEKMVVFSKKIE